MEETMSGVVTANPAIPNPSEELKSSKIRDEGDAFFSGENRNAIHLTGHLIGTVPSSSRPTSTPQAFKEAQGIHKEKTVVGNNSTGIGGVKTRPSLVQSKSKKTMGNSRVVLKSDKPRWYPPSGGSNNLVISFSDDSGSDSEECTEQKASESKSYPTGIQGGQRPAVSFVAKLKKSGQTAGIVHKVIPKKLPMKSKGNSSMAKTFGTAKFRGTGSSSVIQGSQVRYFNTHKSTANQVVDSNISKVQDLRQQIAFRESQMKFKASQNKGTALASSKGSRKWILASADGSQSEPKEPEKKRLRVGESDIIHSSLNCQREVLTEKLNPPSKEPELEKSSVQNRNEADQSLKAIPISRPDSSIAVQKKHDNKAVDVLSPNIAITSIDGDSINCHNSQTERNKGLEDSSDLSNQTAKCAKITPSDLPKNLTSQMIQDELNHPSMVRGHSPPRPSVNKTTSEQNLVNTSSNCAVTCGDKTLVPLIKNKHQRSPENAGIWNDLGSVNGLQCGNIEMQSLVELEEKLDKDLEDAQELRRRFEIKERNALKAYRKAQRALIEANVRCTELYRQREQCAERFRSFLVDESNLLWPSRGQESSGIGLETCNNVPQNMNLVPASSHQFQHEHHGFNQPAFDSNVHHVNLVPRNMSYQHANGPHLVSEQCSELDDSTSEPLPHYSNIVNGVRSPGDNPLGSVGEDEELSFLDHDSLQPSVEYRQKNLNSEEIQRGSNESDKNICIDGSKNYLLLEEAALRSELVVHLGGRTVSNNFCTSDNVQPAVDLGAESDVGSEKTQISNGSVSFSPGPEGQRRLRSESPEQNDEQCQTERGVSKLLLTTDPEESGSSIGCHFLISKTFSSPFLVRSVYEHMKLLFRVTLTELWAEHGQNRTYNFDSREGACVNCDYSCSVIVDVDPSRPFCLYELRGKCNNDQCPSQHIRDLSFRNKIQHKSDDSNSECQLALHQRQSNGEKEPSKCHDVLLSPTYLVCLDILEADTHSLESILARRSVDFWWKCFSICLALSSSFRKDLSGDKVYLDGSGGRIEAHGDWNRQSSFFQSRNGIVNKLKDALGTNTQSLETALLILNQDVSKVEGIIKALSVLSRALEGDQTSEILWVVYLLICYSEMKLAGKDDMFLHAVKHNEGSYVLWLLYINSRQKIYEQMDAYDAALFALSHSESFFDKDRMYTSACILDLFLRMMNCFCMSGNFEKAIQRIYGLLPATKDTDEPHAVMLADILTCLTISDKCMFWISCVYLVLYRKLPESVVEQFEYEKELLPIDWPGVNLGQNEKQGSLKLVEAAVSSIDFCFIDESFKIKNETDLRSAQIFALNHIRCMVALDGMECYWKLWQNYVKKYPSCLELVLMATRMQKNDSHNVGFVRFEEVLHDWPSNAPGVQCIWNQYAEYAMQNGELVFAKKLMAHWYDSVWRVKNPHNESMDAVTSSTSKQMDIMFGFLNLSLHKFLQNDLLEARVSIDQALEAAGPGGFKHCIKEHAAFMVTTDSLLKEDSPISEQLKILRVYLNAVRTFPVLKPLSRHFIKDIEKPRVRQLVSNILCPVSSDSSLVNSVLEAWYGTPLLPPRITKVKDLVDFVEGILEIAPYNYRLVISLCKQLSRGYQYSCFASASVLFWASSTLMNATFCAIPIPAEHVWIEAAGILGNILGNEARHEGFYKKAVSVHPFSLKLWRCYRDQSKTKDRSIVVEAARERGIDLD